MSAALFGISTARHSRLCRLLVVICNQLESDNEIWQSRWMRVNVKCKRCYSVFLSTRKIL